MADENLPTFELPAQTVTPEGDKNEKSTRQHLWLRKWRILITDANDKKALDVSDLHCTFSVEKKRSVTNFATINIYNLNEETEKKIISTGNRLIIEAGYEGQISVNKNNNTPLSKVVGDDTFKETGKEKQYGVIFDGEIIYPTRHKENNTDFVLTLLAVDGANPLRKNFIAQTHNRGLNQRQIVDIACSKAKVATPQNKISQGLSGQRLPRGKVFFGSPKDIISNVARNNAADWWIEDGQLNIQKLTDNPAGDTIVVSPTTSLIGMPQQTQDGVNFIILLNPAIKIGQTMIRLKNSEIREMQANPGKPPPKLDDERLYQVIQAVHKGDTRGNDWYTEISAISRYGKGVLAAILSNSAQNPQSV